MNTLPNVNTHRGGSRTSYVGLTSNVSPKVQSQMAENSHTGVSLDFALKERCQWYVFRATYGRTENARAVFQAKNIKTYIPMKMSVKENNGRKRHLREPLIPNLIFAYMTRQQTYEFIKKPAPTAAFLKYYIDKTKPIEPITGFHPPLIVPDNEMQNFINATSVMSENSMMLPAERVHYKNGNLVRIITGRFKGVVGKVVRAAGQQRVAIHVEGLGTFVTAYIPNDFMEILSE